MRQSLGSLLLVSATLSLMVAIACGDAGDASSGSAVQRTLEACVERPDPAACIESVNATMEAGRPTPAPPDPRIRQIFMEDDVVRSLIGDGVERQDYWLIIDQITNGAHGDEGGMVIVIFAEPVSYSGEVPARSQPCKGRGDEGHVDPDDPCLDEPREYGSRHIDFADMPVVHVGVDTGRGEVVSFLPDDTPPDIVADMIGWAEETQY